MTEKSPKHLPTSYYLDGINQYGINNFQDQLKAYRALVTEALEMLTPAQRAELDEREPVQAIRQRIDLPRDQRPVSEGFTQAQLEAAFNAVKPSNWKDPFEAVIRREDYKVTSAATTYFVGGILEVVEELPDDKIRVYSAGYYNNIGA